MANNQAYNQPGLVNGKSGARGPRTKKQLRKFKDKVEMMQRNEYLAKMQRIDQLRNVNLQTKKGDK